LQAMQPRVSSKEEHTTLREETSARSKKIMKKSKSIKLKTKEAGKPKITFLGRKKKSSVKPKDEEASLSSSCATRSSKTQDGAHGLLSVSTSKEEGIMTTDSYNNIVQRDVGDQHLDRKSSIQENKKKKPVLVPVVIDRRSKVEANNNNSTTNTVALSEKKKKENLSSYETTSTKGAKELIKMYPSTTIVDSCENKKNEVKSSSQTISTRSATNPTKKYTASTGSTQTKNKTAKKYVLSKLEAAKSTISTMSPSTLMSSKKTSVNNSSSGKTNPTPITSQNSVTTANVGLQNNPRNQKEKAVIVKLQRTISAQEDRIEEIEGKQIPLLLRAAKTWLKENNKKEALKCLAHKKRLERQVDVTKAAVFNMETQMFMLESAIEDRYIKKALDEAATAIAGFQENMSDPKAVILETMKMSESLPELDVGDFTDEELMEELQDWLSPEDKRRAQENQDSNDEDILLLSIPTFLPTAPVTTPSVDRTLNVLISE